MAGHHQSPRAKFVPRRKESPRHDQYGMGSYVHCILRRKAGTTKDVGDHRSGYRQFHPCERRDLLSNKKPCFSLTGFSTCPMIDDVLCPQAVSESGNQHAANAVEYRNVPGYSAGRSFHYIGKLLPDRSLSDAFFSTPAEQKDVQACVPPIWTYLELFRSTDLYGRVLWGACFIPHTDASHVSRPYSRK